MPRTPRILMCPPDHFGIEYEINPWMRRSIQADRTAAMNQWRSLVSLLESLGAVIDLLEPTAGLPDLVFTANAAMIHRNVAIASHFRHVERQGEEPINRKWLTERGFEVIEAPAGVAFEGAGDALFCGDTLFAGYRQRSDANGLQQIAAMLGVRVIPVELADSRFYHIDTCFCPLSPDCAAWHPAAFDDYGRRALREHVPRLIEVQANEAAHFACNAVAVGRSVVTNVGCPQFHSRLRDEGFEPYETPLHEFVKAGGSAKCLTLRLDGEDAASWAA